MKRTDSEVTKEVSESLTCLCQSVEHCWIARRRRDDVALTRFKLDVNYWAGVLQSNIAQLQAGTQEDET